jgi:glycerophosphoryl diester phosphodiesterase
MIENKFDANIFWASVSRTRVKRLHKAGLKVNCWTVDGAACATLMQDYGVDQITTNILE